MPQQRPFRLVDEQGKPIEASAPVPAAFKLVDADGVSPLPLTDSIKSGILEDQAKKYPTEAESGRPVLAGFTRVAENLKDYFRPAMKAANDFFEGEQKSFVRGIPLTVAKALGTVPKETTAEDIGMQSDNGMQDLGGGVERIAEYMIPGSATSKLANAGKLGMMGRAGLESATAYGMAKLHDDSNDDAVRNAVISGGLTLGASTALKALGKMGERMELSAVKPLKNTLADVKGAAPGKEAEKLISDIYKYKLGGTLDQSMAKSDAALDGLEKQLQSVLKSQPSAKVNLYQAVNDAALELEKAGTLAKNASKNAAIQRALIEQIDNIDMLNHFGAVQNGEADLVIANQFKRGLPGAWLNGFADPDNEAKQIVATAVYKQMRQQIENAAAKAGPLVKDLNRQMGDILPIRDALIQRIPVARRREIISLKEAIGLASGSGVGFGYSMLDRLMRSPSAANRFVQGAAKGSAIAPRIGQVGAGVGPPSPDKQ